MRRVIQVLGLLSLVLVFAAIACVATIFLVTGNDPLTAARDGLAQLQLARSADELNTPAGTSDEAVRFVVVPGTATSQIAEGLSVNGLITDPDLFVTYVVASGLAGELEAGTYFLANNMPITEIAERLTDSNSSRLLFRILPGWRAEEVAAAIDAHGGFEFSGEAFMQAVEAGASALPAFADSVGLPAQASWEGFLFPDSYLLPPNITPPELVQTLTERFREQVPPQLIADAATQDISLYEAVVIASIAQREAIHPEEYPLITSVYRNRIDEGMKLDADPTVQYALGASGQWWNNITREDYTGVDSPYNTYLYTGLPPGPIANPSLAALQAAVNPTTTEYLYFRTFCDESGYHEFARTYEQHLLNGCTG